MAWQPNKPQATDLLSTSQADIQGNFISIGTLLDPTNINVQFPTGIAPATGPTTVGLFSALSAISGNTELWFRPINSGAPVQFTAAVKAKPGACQLPCGIILKWGTGSIAINNPSIIATFNVSFPFTVAPIVVVSGNTQPTEHAAPGRNIFAAINININNFTATRSTYSMGEQVTFTYFALGW